MNEKKGCLYIVGEVFLLVEAIIMVIGGERGVEYTLVLFFSISLLVITIIDWILKEVKIRRKMKEIEEARENQERNT